MFTEIYFEPKFPIINKFKSNQDLKESWVNMRLIEEMEKVFIFYNRSSLKSVKKILFLETKFSSMKKVKLYLSQLIKSPVLMFSWKYLMILNSKIMILTHWMVNKFFIKKINFLIHQLNLFKRTYILAMIAIITTSNQVTFLTKIS